MKINNNGTFVDVKKIFINDNGTFKEVKKILDSSDTVLYNNTSEEIQPETYECEFVDLDLPSGTLWADRNLGAGSSYEYGTYHQWADDASYSNNGTTFDTWANYKWMQNNKLTKYCTDSDYGTVDNKIIIETSDDAAYRISNGVCKIPTKAQFQELLDNCTISCVTVNGIKGCRFSRNYKSIFLPFSGKGGLQSSIYSYGVYSTSNLGDYSDYWQYAFKINQSSSLPDNITYSLDDMIIRNAGTSIRPVKI